MSEHHHAHDAAPGEGGDFGEHSVSESCATM